MDKKRVVITANVALGLISLLLLFNLIGFEMPNIGYALYDKVDFHDPVCFLESFGEVQEISLSLCYHYARQTMSCGVVDGIEIHGKTIDALCSTTKDHIYYLNNAALREMRSLV